VADPIVACVRTGSLYPFDYVTKLRNMVARYMPQPYTFVCLTDMPQRCERVVFVDVREMGLQDWWAKLILFEPGWRGRSQIIYLDLDTVIIGDLAPLKGVPDEFAILASPVRLAGNQKYPCAYNSSVMTIGGGQCGFVWQRFDKHRAHLINKHKIYGDQAAIEELYPRATFLNGIMPFQFFLNYRNLTMHKPPSSVINFGGNHKPHNCPIPWVQEAWQ
jgi:hypothetical protein